jgi:hypothetical protein
MGFGGMHTGYSWEGREEGDHCEDEDLVQWTILKCILEK